MAIKKIQIIPPDNNYTDVLHPETSADQVIASDGKTIEQKLGSVAMTTTAQTVTGAINELDNDIGNKSTLITTNKTNLVNAVNENREQINTLVAQFCKIYLNPYQNIPSATLTKVAFNKALKDNANMANLANNAIVIKRAGTYLLFGQVNWETASGEKVIFLYKNGTMYASASLAGSPTDSTSPFIIALPFEINDELTLYVRIGTAQAILAADNGTRTSMAVLRIGD